MTGKPLRQAARLPDISAFRLGRQFRRARSYDATIVPKRPLSVLRKGHHPVGPKRTGWSLAGGRFASITPTVASDAATYLGQSSDTAFRTAVGLLTLSIHAASFDLEWCPKVPNNPQPRACRTVRALFHRCRTKSHVLGPRHNCRSGSGLGPCRAVRIQVCSNPGGTRTRGIRTDDFTVIWHFSSFRQRLRPQEAHYPILSDAKDPGEAGKTTVLCALMNTLPLTCAWIARASTSASTSRPRLT